MSPRKQIERTPEDNIFQSIEIIVSITALQNKLRLRLRNHTRPADKIAADKCLILHLSAVEVAFILSASARIVSGAGARFSLHREKAALQCH